MKKFLLPALCLAFALTAASIAWSFEGDTGVVNARQDRAISATRAGLKIQGELSCAYVSNGEPCSLKLTEKGTGAVYELVGSSAQAMRLLNDGQKSVAIEGRAAGEHAITVSKVTAVRNL